LVRATTFHVLGYCSEIPAPSTFVVVIYGAFAVAAFAIAGAEAMTTVANIALPIVRNIMLLSRFSSSST
jgi:hypothetical protein